MRVLCVGACSVVDLPLYAVSMVEEIVRKEIVRGELGD